MSGKVAEIASGASATLPDIPSGAPARLSAMSGCAPLASSALAPNRCLDLLMTSSIPTDIPLLLTRAVVSAN
jgi:hypothetical protein